MLGLQDPCSRRHYESQQRPQCQPPRMPQIDNQIRLDDAKRRAMTSIRHSNQPPRPTPLSNVWSADEDMTDEEPTNQHSLRCFPSRPIPGEGKILFESTSFMKPPSSVLKADIDDDYREPGQWGGQKRSAIRGGSSPAANASTFLKDDPQISKVEITRNTDSWAAAPWSTRAPSIFPDAVVVAAKAANIASTVSSPVLGRNDADMEEYVPPAAMSPPTTSWPTTAQAQHQSANVSVQIENNFAPLNSSFSNKTKEPLNPVSLTAFQPLASAAWTTPTTASVIKLSKTPLPLSTTLASISTTMAAWNPPDMQMTTPEPTSHPRFNFNLRPTSCPQYLQAKQYSHISLSQAVAPPYTISPPRLHHLHIAPTAALSFSPPLPSPPLTAASSRPQLSTSIYLACLAKQVKDTRRDLKVMLKCKMVTCLQREGVTFGGESLRNGTIDTYRNGFGCGGCGEMLDVVVC